MNFGNLISGSSASSKSSLYIWKFSIHILLKPSLKELDYKLASMWNDCNCMVVSTFFVIAFLWDWNENWPFSVLWPLMNFPNFLTYWVSTLIASSFRILNSPGKIQSIPLPLFMVILSKAHLTLNSRIFSPRWVTTPL